MQLKFTYVNPLTVTNYIFSNPNYNSSLTMLKLEKDGNLKAYTYYDNGGFGEWEVTFTLFSRKKTAENANCRNHLPTGLMGWSKDCESPKLVSEKDKYYYYLVEGVDHFVSVFSNAG